MPPAPLASTQLDDFSTGIFHDMNDLDPQEIRRFVQQPQFDLSSKLDPDTTWPKISIVVPSFNQAAFLERTLLSVLNQRYPNLELLVLDGGSSDASVDIIRKYERQIDYWVSERDGGQVAAINAGFRRATGELVAWQNSDDVYLPGALERIARHSRALPNADVYHGHLLLIDADDSLIETLHYAPYSVWNALYLGGGAANQSAFFRADVVQRFELDATLHCALDGEYFLRLARSGVRFKLVPEYFGCLRIHGSTKTNLADPTLRISEGKRIRAAAGVEVRTDIPWRRQYVVRKAVARLRKLAYFVRHDRKYIRTRAARSARRIADIIGASSR